MNRRRAPGCRGVAELTSSLPARALLTGTLDLGLLEPLWAIRCRRSHFGLGTYRCKNVANASSSDGNVLCRKRQEAQLGSPHKSLQPSFHAGWDCVARTASTSSFAVSRVGRRHRPGGRSSPPGGRLPHEHPLSAAGSTTDQGLAQAFCAPRFSGAPYRFSACSPASEAYHKRPGGSGT
jgi:hypothetical protein